MAFLQMNYHSDALKMGVSVNVILPEKAKTVIGMSADGKDTYKTLYLLHGLSDDQTIWMRRTSIERYASEYGIAVVMPCVARSWYVDTAYGMNYFTFVSEELPRVCRGFFKGMSDKREDNFIAGLSMGGYGALKVALTYPERFGGCASLSGALDFANFAIRKRLNITDELKGIFGADFDENTDMRGTAHDVQHLARIACEQGAELPKIYMWCGTEDSLIAVNREYHATLDTLGIEHLYEESEGNHSWKYWDTHIQDAMRNILK